MKKKVLLTGVLVFALASCGGGSDDEGISTKITDEKTANIATMATQEIFMAAFQSVSHDEDKSSILIEALKGVNLAKGGTIIANSDVKTNAALPLLKSSSTYTINDGKGGSCNVEYTPSESKYTFNITCNNFSVDFTYEGEDYTTATDGSLNMIVTTSGSTFIIDVDADLNITINGVTYNTSIDVKITVTYDESTGSVTVRIEGKVDDVNVNETCTITSTDVNCSY